MYVPYRLNQRTFFIKRTTATKHIIYKYTQVVKQMEYKKKFDDSNNSHKLNHLSSLELKMVYIFVSNYFFLF